MVQYGCRIRIVQRHADQGSTSLFHKYVYDIMSTSSDYSFSLLYMHTPYIYI